MKILYIPLDERPCNFQNTIDLFPTSNIITPDIEILGNKKVSANKKELLSFVLENYKNVDSIVLSMDMLFFGGLLPSRLHHENTEYAEAVLKALESIKKEKPKIKIFGFQLIMRTPQYNSSDEEPDYYEEYGLDIFNYGVSLHKKQLGLENENVSVPEEYINDFMRRRDVNLKYLFKTLNALNNNIFDYFVIPQDDSHKYGFTAIDQIKVNEYISGNDIDNILIYPGADEVGAALIGRAVSTSKKSIYIMERTTDGIKEIPKYEDREQIKSINAQLEVSNFKRVSKMNDADAILALNSVHPLALEAWEQEKDSDPNFKIFAKNILNNIDNLPIVVADTRFSNGGDLNLVKELDKCNLFKKIVDYNGWNTSSNTLGFSLASLNEYLFSKKLNIEVIKKHVIEDGIYQGYVRKYITDNVLAKNDLDYFNLKDKQNLIIKKEEEIIKNYLNKNVTNLNIEKVDIYHPWNRMFEIGVK